MSYSGIDQQNIENGRFQINLPQQHHMPRNYNNAQGNNLQSSSSGIGMAFSPNTEVYGQSIGNASGIGIGSRPYEQDNKSITSTPSKISKFTYSEYPQVKPTNPLYTSTHTIKTQQSGMSRASTMNTVSRRAKYDPNKPRRISDWRWVGGLSALMFVPTGAIALGLAFKARNKFEDGFIDEAKKLNKKALTLCIVSIVLGMAWILTVFFLVDKWPRTNG